MIAIIHFGDASNLQTQLLRNLSPDRAGKQYGKNQSFADQYAAESIWTAPGLVDNPSLCSKF
jgi:hypothetical protein